ncbi:hypothetical protein PY254_04815 [Rhodanobacter sp. AS-Z3]|uniref:hypothetical protein n=1 Tax=Rhodanobacter sp. AS-Z3 TaxID=3031330 RepID=UPI00247839EF|nr:hypothetical protein [Rhodanobacter sp. AS-Z3]WEN15998.1 hypothetical protein PY254_04815 [Rhodanobacter sp. AS-Z3]
MNAIGFVLLCLITFALAGWLTWRHYVNARELLQSWADANGYKILHATRPLFMPWSMYFGTSKYQVVYHVAVYDASLKRIRSAWVRLGTYWTGSMDGDAITVQWEHEA